MRSEFKVHAKAAVPVFFGKFKEKRLVEDILTNFEHIMICIELADTLEFLGEVTTAKAPAVKLNILVFLQKAILTTYIDELEDVKD